jgi:pyruvate formate lyase activating enzyme
MRLAKKNGILSAYITNGYATEEHLELISPYLDAWRVDIKGFSKESYKKVTGIAKWEAVLGMAKLAKFKYNMHVECVTNITPTINDSEEVIRGIARWIKTDLGEFTPWHVTRFYPYLDLSHIPPTPIRTLELAYEIGREEGLRYVYVGNLPGHRWEDTYCHNCHKPIIQRRGFAIAQAIIQSGRCPYCQTEIPGRWDSSISVTSGERIPVVQADFELPYKDKQ